jgi:hypothetical protein
VPNVVIGSPTGNRLAAAFHGKYRRHEPDRRRELVHEGVDGLEFPFEFALDGSDAEHPAVRTPSGQYAWALYRSGSKQGCEYEPQHRQRSYLSVSVVPNFTARGEFWRRPPVVLLEGCDALGTSGIGKLFHPDALGARGALTELQDRVERRSPDERYWQAIFEISGCMPHTNVFGHRDDHATHIHLADFGWITPNVDRIRRYDNLAKHSLEVAVTTLRRGSRT